MSLVVARRGVRPCVVILMLVALSLASGAAEDDTCKPRLQTALDTVMQRLRKSIANEKDGIVAWPHSDVEALAPEIAQCLQKHDELPRRTSFFSRIGRPDGVPAERFAGMLANSGIHPRGVILDSEFYEMPLQLDAQKLAEDVEALIAGDADGWEVPTAENVNQGVVSKHFRLVVSSKGSGSFKGPFKEAAGRLSSQSSGYLRRVLHSLGGGVLGNTALMSLPPGGKVDGHFDTSSYWFHRVRVHIPVKTNLNCTFTCGATGAEHTIHMEAGKVYVFDNHLGHAVDNAGSEPRIHLTADIVGSRRFWSLVEGARKIGSSTQSAKLDTQVIPVHGSEGLPIVLEGWDDAKVLEATKKGSCRDLVRALNSTAWPAVHARHGQAAQAAAKQLTTIGTKWCDHISFKDTKKDSCQHGPFSRAEEVELLQRLVARWDCEGPIGQPGASSIRDIVDVIAELHRVEESLEDLKVVGGETHDR